MYSIFNRLTDSYLRVQCKSCLGIGNDFMQSVSMTDYQETEHEECLNCNGTGIDVPFIKKENREAFLKVLKILQKTKNVVENVGVIDDEHEMIDAAFDVQSIINGTPDARIDDSHENMVIFTLENHGIIIMDGNIISVF